MASIHERHGSRDLSVTREGGSAPFLYFVRDAASQEAAQILAAATAPATYTPPGAGPLIQQSFETEDLGAGNYLVTVNYESGKADDNAAAASAPVPTPGADPATTYEGGGNVAGGTDATTPVGREMSFSTGGGTKHVTQSLKTIRTMGAAEVAQIAAIEAAYADAGVKEAIYEADLAYALAFPGDAGLAAIAAASLATYKTAADAAETAMFSGGGRAPNFNKAIGVGDDGPEGCDIVAPDAKFQITFKVPQLTIGRFIRLQFLTGRVNSKPWQGLGKREVLFIGADGSYSDGDKKWTVTYQFQYSPTERDIAVAPGIMIKEKLGWDYLWVLYEEKENTITKKMVKSPTAAYVEQVYEETDFAVGMGF